MIQISVFNVTAGDKEIKFEDVSQEERAELALRMEYFFKQGYTISVNFGDEEKRVTGYDSKSNEWILAEKQSKTRKPVRRAATKTRATAIAPTAGG